MYVTKHLDWLSCTTPKTFSHMVAFPLLRWRYVSRGNHGYAERYVCSKTGVVCQEQSQDEAMGCHYDFGGEALNLLRQEQGGTDDGLVNRLIRMGARASRIDLTINLHESNLTPRKVRDAVRSGEATARANVSRFIEGKDGNVEGDTFYIGSPSSDRQFRAYNKASELHIVDGAAWLRLELELRRLRANGAFQSVASNGVDATVTGHMADFLDWGNMEYKTALQGPSVPPIDIPRRDSNRQRWLLGQVASALAKEIALDRGFLNKFMTALGAECERLDIDLTEGE